MIELRVLGPFELLKYGQILELGPRKQRAVLAVLTIEAGRVVSLDRLIDELWGEEPPAQAIGTLQAYVSNLRRILEPDRGRRDPPRLLVTRSPGYVLNVDAAALDRDRFEETARQGRGLLTEHRPQAARRRLEEALALWRGPALADFAFEPFAQAEATRLNELRLVAQEDRLQADLDLGSHAAAVPELEAAVAAHPLRERLVAMLMLASYRAGRQAEALASYQAARRRLTEELGIEPAPALRRLESDILAQASSLDWVPPTVEEALLPMHGTFLGEPGPPGNGRASGSSSFSKPPAGEGEPPIVGRRAEQDALQEALARAAGGRGGAVLVLGEPGIGKTRLVASLVERAADQEALSAWGGNIEGEGAPAYWPWVEIIRSLVAQAGALGIRLGDSRGMAELAQVVPEIGQMVGGLGAAPALDPDTARLRLFEAASTILTTFSYAQPLVVVLDDLQWADPASLQLLCFLAPRLKGSRLLVLGTYRPAEIGPDHPLNDALAALSRHQVAERLPLKGLERAEIADLIEVTTGSAPAVETVDAVSARTEGNPFFVTEVARLLASEHRIDDSGTELSAVPAGVRDVVKRRLARLPDETVALLSLAAVSGRDFDLAVLEHSAELDPERTLELVEAGLMSELVQESPGTLGQFRFSHDLVRETILAELSSLRRARLHGRVGRAIEAAYGPEPSRALELANHFYLAASVVGPEKAIPPHIEAADVARARLAYEQAEEQLGRALELVNLVRAGAERDRLELEIQLRITSLVMMTKGYAAPEAGRALERGRRLCEALGETRELVRVLWGLFAFEFVGARYQVGRRYAEQLLQIAEASGHPAELVAGHHAVGSAALHQGDYPTARRHLEQALAIPDGLHDPWLVSWLPQHPYVACTCFLAFALWGLGDSERALGLADDAARYAEQLGHDPTIAHALDLYAWVASLEQDAPRTLAAGERAIEFAEQKRFPMYVALNSILVGWARAMDGKAGQGIEEMRRGLADMKATGAFMLQTYFLCRLAEALQLGGAPPEERLSMLDEALGLIPTTGEGFWEPELHRQRGEILARMPGRQAEAEAALRHALDSAERRGAVALRDRALRSLACRTGEGIVA